MASEQDTKDEDSIEADEATGAETSIVAASTTEELVSESDELATAPMGARRYVHASFFVAGILLAFVSHKMLGLVWAWLADWPTAVRAVPALVSYPEDQREGATLVAGAVIGALGVFQSYRKEGIRRWADEVALELTKVTWPTRDVVVNGTLVVVIASAVATAYVAILDRFWSFLTTLVYGA